VKSRARDTKLGRGVALKILPKTFTNDPERVARFRREAQVLAALNHPRIGAIYGVMSVGRQDYRRRVSASVKSLTRGSSQNRMDRVQRDHAPSGAIDRSVVGLSDPMYAMVCICTVLTASVRATNRQTDVVAVEKQNSSVAVFNCAANVSSLSGDNPSFRQPPYFLKWEAAVLSVPQRYPRTRPSPHAAIAAAVETNDPIALEANDLFLKGPAIA
jgi:hypothetical protein